MAHTRSIDLVSPKDKPLPHGEDSALLSNFCKGRARQWACLQFMLVCVLVLRTSTVAHAFTYTFTRIDVPGALFTSVHGINDAGEIVGTFRDTSFKDHGFVLTGGTFTPIDVPGAVFTAVRGINHLGQIVGFFREATGEQHGFVRSKHTVTLIDVPDAAITSVQGINDVGEIVGTFCPTLIGSEIYSFVQDGDSFTPLEFPNATPGTTQVRGINNAGRIVGIFNDATGQHGFLATPVLQLAY